MRHELLLWLAAPVVVLSACSGALARRGALDLTIGRASLRDIMTEVPAVLQLYGFAVYENRPTGSTLYIETGWQERAPFDDEVEAGVESARTRFIARGRKAGPTTYTLRITVENQVMVYADTAPEVVPVWSTMRPTRMYLAFVREITTEIEMKVDAGLRKYDVQLARVEAGSVAPSRSQP